jgi:hypothetical protein
MADPIQEQYRAIKAKGQMLELGLTRARKRCPHCCGMARLRLAGPNNHVHARCETTYGCLWFIE